MGIHRIYMGGWEVRRVRKEDEGGEKGREGGKEGEREGERGGRVLGSLV